eukprot:Colp12_sorted_trinity150504_noHs@5056
MAEAVNLLLEEMIPEFEDWEKRGLFTKQEIKQIIKKRTYFEYCVRRRQPSKLDFLRYIQYELNLDALRRKRKERLNQNRKNYASEYALVRRLHFIFSRALKKFKGDVKLWLQYIEFCKRSESSKLLSKTFAAALQYHPLNAGLWILAAKWEYDTNANIKAARVLIQRGIRLIPENRKLWHEYHKLELLYLEKIQKRRELLTGTSTANSIDLPKLDEEKEEEAAEDVIDSTLADAAEETPKSPIDVFLSGELPRIVYRNAIKAIPEDVSFRLGFLSNYRLFKGTKASQDLVFQSLVEDFPNNEEARAAVARRPMDDLGSAGEFLAVAEIEKIEKAVIGRFEKAVKELNTAPMWSLYVGFLRERLGKCGLGDERVTSLIETLLDTYTRADKEVASAAMFLEHADTLIKLGKVALALKVLEAGTVAHPSDVKVWHALVVTSLRANHTKISQTVHAREALGRALAHVAVKDQLMLRALRIEIAIVEGADCEKVMKLYREAIATRCEGFETLMEAYIDYALVNLPADGAREVYTSLCAVRPVPLRVYQKAISAENSQASAQLGVLRALYESAVSDHGSYCTDLWLAYVELERSKNHFDKASQLQWRAVKALADPAAFNAKLSLAGFGARDDMEL